MFMADNYDVLVIGAGPGGYVAALRASQLGAKVGIVEDTFIGGVCLNVGCIPSKALLRSAEVYETLGEAKQFGIVVDGTVEPDWPAIQAVKDQAVKRLTGGVGTLLRKAGVTIYEGRGRFRDRHTVEVGAADGTRQLTADKVIVATGSRPIHLPLPGFDLPGVLDSTGALSLASLPDSLLIVGGGVIGVEFANIYASFGVQVIVVEMLDRLLPMMDPEISTEVTRSLRRKKVASYVQSRANEIVQQGDLLHVSVTTPKGAEQFDVEKVLVSVGRRPNVEDLGLEGIGVQIERGIVVNERMETNVPGVYAIGDVTGKWWLAHVASKEGTIAAENACGHPARADYKSVPACVFTHPEVATVGLTEEQARAQGYDVLVGKFPFLANGKAVTYGERGGFVKIVSEQKYGEVLGLHIVGPHASDLILEGGLALQLEATLDEIDATTHAHPTLGEAIAEAALDAQGRALQI
jgi:dihydrolipoamide dehydrogenase